MVYASARSLLHGRSAQRHRRAGAGSCWPGTSFRAARWRSAGCAAMPRGSWRSGQQTRDRGHRGRWQSSTATLEVGWVREGADMTRPRKTPVWVIVLAEILDCIDENKVLDPGSEPEKSLLGQLQCPAADEVIIALRKSFSLTYPRNPFIEGLQQALSEIRR